MAKHSKGLHILRPKELATEKKETKELEGITAEEVVEDTTAVAEVVVVPIGMTSILILTIPSTGKFGEV